MVIRPETALKLEKYLRFRHIFRNVYGFELEWEFILALLDHLSEAWLAVEGDVERFLGFLDRAATQTEMESP